MNTPPPSQLLPGSSQLFESHVAAESASQNEAIDPTNTLRKLQSDDLISCIPDPTTIKFEPLKMNTTSLPAVKILQDEDGDSPLSLFSLFLLWKSEKRKERNTSSPERVKYGSPTRDRNTTAKTTPVTVPPLHLHLDSSG